MNQEINISKFKNIAVIGMGRIGLPLAVCYASRGFNVFGVDNDINKIALLNKKKLSLNETNLFELFNKHKKEIIFTSNIVSAVKKSTIIYIVVPTPSEKNGNFSLEYVIEVCSNIGHILQRDKSWKLISVLSTVSPGSMDNIIKPALEKASGKKAGIDFGLCYSPEFVALGNVINNFFNPDFILIGESDKYSGKILANLRKRICRNNPPIHLTNYINAELAKLGSNTFITTKISFANMLARICEKTPGADIDTITSVLGDDSSIGAKRLTGSISYGGPCYPRDNVALSTYARKIGSSADLAEMTHSYNRLQQQYLFDQVMKYSGKNLTVGILGLSYKPNTDVTEESAGVKLVSNLALEKLPVIVYDPMGMDNAKLVLDKYVEYAKSSSECIIKSDVIVITTAWSEFQNIKSSVWLEPSRERIVIDCWRMLKLKNQKGLQYIPLGIGMLP